MLLSPAEQTKTEFLFCPSFVRADVAEGMSSFTVLVSSRRNESSRARGSAFYG